MHLIKNRNVLTPQNSFVRLIAASAALVMATQAWASGGGDGPGTPLVTVTGSLDPQFQVALKPAEFENIQKGLQGLGNLKPITVNINDLMSDEDIPAIRQATQLISDIFVQSAKNIVVIQVLAYRYAAAMRLNAAGSYSEVLRDSYQRESEKLYQAIIQSFILQNGERFKQAMLACRTDICATRIGFAQEELVEFGWAMNVGVTVGSAAKIQLPKMKSELVNYAVQESLVQIREKAKAPGESLVATSFAALSPAEDRSVDLSAVINTGVVRENRELYVLRAVTMKKKEKKKLASALQEAAKTAISAKVAAMAKPTFEAPGAPQVSSGPQGRSSFERPGGKIDRSILNVTAHGDYFDFLFREVSKGLGKCSIADKSAEAKLGLSNYKYYLNVGGTYDSRADYIDTLARELYPIIKAGKCGELVN